MPREGAESVVFGSYTAHCPLAIARDDSRVHAY